MARDLREIEDRFHSALYSVLADKLNSACEHLISGGAIDYARYLEQVGYIRGLRDVMEWADEVERDQYGPR